MLFAAVHCLRNGAFFHDGDFGATDPAKHLATPTTAALNECPPPSPFASSNCERFLFLRVGSMSASIHLYCRWALVGAISGERHRSMSVSRHDA